MKRLIGLMAWLGLASRLTALGYYGWWVFIAVQPRLPEEQNEHIINGILATLILVPLILLFDELTPGGTRQERRQAENQRKRERNIP